MSVISFCSCITLSIFFTYNSALKHALFISYGVPGFLSILKYITKIQINNLGHKLKVVI